MSLSNYYNLTEVSDNTYKVIPDCLTDGNFTVKLPSNISEDAIFSLEGHTHENQFPSLEDYRSNTKVISDKLKTLDSDLIEEIDARTALDESVKNELLQLTDMKIDDAYVEDGYLYMLSNGNVAVGPLGPFSGTGGGGGSSGNAASFKVSVLTDWLSTTISDTSGCEISFSWSSIEEEQSTGAGTLSITVNGISKVKRNIEQGIITTDIKEYLNVGENTVKVTIADVYNNSRTITFRVNVISISIESTFTASSPFTGDINYYFTPIGGNLKKNVYFYIDNKLHDTMTVSTTGRQINYTISGLDSGTHTFDVYYECIIGGETAKSNTLHYDLMILDEGNNDTIIATSFNQTEVKQYYTVTIPYTVYKPSSLTTTVYLYENDALVQTLYNVGREEQTWSYRPSSDGGVSLRISADGTDKVIKLTVAKSEVDVEAETNGLALYLSSYGRNNNEKNPAAWEYKNIKTQFKNFNWTSDGWQLDDDGISVLKISGDARVYIPYEIFSTNFVDTQYSGKTIELEFATQDVMDYEAVIVSCIAGLNVFDADITQADIDNVANKAGLCLTAQNIKMSSTGSSVSTQYKEDEHVRISFVIENKAANRLISVYINSILSGVIQYGVDDSFSQGKDSVGISIGSNDCTLLLYNIRVYDNALSRFQVLHNWIADTQDGATMVERYLHNDIYDSDGQTILISKLPSNLPYLVFTSKDMPMYKGDKKTDCCGYYVDPSNPERSFSFENAESNVQGTSSAGYPRKNYKIKFKNGFTMTSTGETVKKISFKPGAKKEKTFTFKADYASSEGCNNVELVRLYNDTCPYQTPPQKEDSSIRQGIDGFPIVIFHEVDGVLNFVGKYNFNNDKSNEDTFGFIEGDQSWEQLNNTTDRSLWKDADFTSGEFNEEENRFKYNWEDDFESRFPDADAVDWDATELAKVAAWVASTYRKPTDSEEVKTEKLNKFRNELSDWFVKEDAIFYYIFTELFLMIDSRAKNAFPTRFNSEGKWCWLPYDMDTALGINNEGLLVFDYNLEDTDTITSGEVFNGQSSVFWNNLRDAFFADIKKQYQELRSNKNLPFSYSEIISRFENHQSIWNEAIFNDDSYYKYIEPFTYGYYNSDNELIRADNLAMCQGSKSEQRKWWLYNRFRYLDSKYETGTSASSVITFRAYNRVSMDEDISFKITPYADIYARAKIGSYSGSTRAARGEESSVNISMTGDVNDLETYIYSADQIKDIGDISQIFDAGYCDIGPATRLQSLKIGSKTRLNEKFTSCSFGDNKLLKYVDIRNCPNLQGSINMENCSNIETIYSQGTGISGITLPKGGILKTMYLPSTVTTLTIINQFSLNDFKIFDNSKKIVGDDGEITYEELVDYKNITKVWIENSNAIDYVKVIEGMSENGLLRLIGMEHTFNSLDELRAFYDKMKTLRGINAVGQETDSAQISGKIYLKGNYTGSQLEEFYAAFPDVKILCDELTATVTFYSADGKTVLDTQEISGSTLDNGLSVVYNGEAPTQEQDNVYIYSFSGWSKTLTSSVNYQVDADALIDIYGNRNLYATFFREYRKYNVRFYNPLYSDRKAFKDADLICTVTDAKYGQSLTEIFNGDLPHYGVENTEEWGDFVKWSEDTVTRNGMQVYAVYDYIYPLIRGLLSRTIRKFSHNQDIVLKYRAFRDCELLESVEMPMQEVLPNGCFQGCEALVDVILTNVKTIGDNSFNNCTSLTELNCSNAESIGSYAFNGCTSLTTLAPFKKITKFSGGYVFSNSRLKEITIEQSDTVCECASTTVFQGCKEMVVYVPENLYEDYKKATNWAAAESLKYIKIACKEKESETQSE